MPIELPDLDDIDYDELISGAIAGLPGFGSNWTDYNPSDPGITLLEMLAWLTEMLVYRTNRIQPESCKAFLRLLMGYGESALRDMNAKSAGLDIPAMSDERFDTAPEQVVREVILTLRRRYRAITVADYEELALTTFQTASQIGQHVLDQQIARLVCLPEVDVTNTDRRGPADLAGAMSLVVLPESTVGEPVSWPQPSSDLVDALGDFFEDRRLATTRVCIAGPRYTELNVSATLFICGDARPREVMMEAQRTLFEYLHPLRGGPKGSGWPFGRPVYSSELLAMLATLEGVSFAENVSVTETENAIAAGELVHLEDDQLPQLLRGNIELSAKVLSGSAGQGGSEWVQWSPEVTIK